jgi:hypothetical protein
LIGNHLNLPPMKTKLLLSCLAFLLLPMFAQAIHVMSGHISYTVDEQNPKRFNFTLTIYTNHMSQAEDPDVSMIMGDGNRVVVPRTSVTKYNYRYDTEVFHWTYTYDSPGNYTVAWVGPNRSYNIVNISSPSDQHSTYVYTNVNVNPLSPNRYGAQLAGLPLIEGQVGEPLLHNLVAYDGDGDQLIYQLVTPKKEDKEGNIVDIPGYVVPEGLTISEYGELKWDAPTTAGRYTIALQIKEHRYGIVQGFGVVDFEVVVEDKPNDLRPRLELLNGSKLSLNDDGSLKVLPGEHFKLEYFMRRHPDSDAPVRTKLYSELDTLELLPITISVRDSADGQALTVSFTPGVELVREQAYILGLSAMALETVPPGNYDYPVTTDWEFTYLFIGEYQPTATGDRLKKAGFILYPNPIADQFMVEAPDMPGMFVHLYDATGKRAGALKLKPGKTHFAKPALLSRGLYFYTICSRHRPVGSGKLVVR